MQCCQPSSSDSERRDVEEGRKTLTLQFMPGSSIFLLLHALTGMVVCAVPVRVTDGRSILCSNASSFA
jgi:hypothetical protein